MLQIQCGCATTFGLMNLEFLGQNATRHSRGRRTHARQSGQRPSGSQLARSWQSTPALSSKRKGRIYPNQKFTIVNTWDSQNVKILPAFQFKTCYISFSTYSSFLNCPGMFRSSTTVSFGRTPSMLCRSLIITIPILISSSI